MMRHTLTKIKYAVAILIMCHALYTFGVFTHIFEKDFNTKFEYPLNEDITPFIYQLKNDDQPSLQPINQYNYSYLKACEEKCKGNYVHLVILVKSAMNNFHKREAIRNTFGFERRFSDVPIRTVFLLGVREIDGGDDLQKNVDIESVKYKDIVQSNFIDSYYNNTIKTMMGFKWAMTHCLNSKFYFFVDDDMYVSVKNLLRFLRNPAHYPEYVEEYLKSIKKIKPKTVHKIENTQIQKDTRVKRQIESIYELPDDAQLYAGYMFHTAPHRHRTSKWYVSLDEYPYHLWPQYISAGAYALTKEALITMYYASYYTAHFRFDDIYLGILAKKSGISPFHSNDFYFYKKTYDGANYRYVIASHGYDDPLELSRVWNEQKAAGNA